MGLFGRKKKTDEVKPKSGKDSADLNDEKKSEIQAKAKSMKDLYSEKELKGTAGAKTGKKQKVVRQYGNAYQVLIKPLITEKAANLAAENKYVFEVAQDTNKIAVAKAIKEVYGVIPANINIINVSGKKVRSGRLRGRRKDWKKAIVMLPKGQTINIYEGV